MTSSLTELRPPPTYPTEPPTPTRKQPSSGWYWVAGILAVLGLTAALVWGAVGHHQRAGPGRQLRTHDGSRCGDRAGDRPRDHGRLLREPRRARALRDPTATGRPAIAYNPATDATIEVRYAATTPTWQQLRLTVTGPDGAAVPVSTYRSSARYDVNPGRLGRAVAKFEATIPGQYRVSAARAVEPGATLAVGDNFARSIAMTALGAATLALVTVVAAVLLAVVTTRARSRITR